MAPPDFQELATLANFIDLGLPAPSLRSAPSRFSAVIVTGAGTATLTPVDNASLDVAAQLVTELTVTVEIVVGGALGVATWRWRIGTGSWSAAATTPTSGELALERTGLRARLAGTATTSDQYTWTATSCVGPCLRAANESACRWLHRRYRAPLTTIPTDLVRDVCVVAAADVMAVRGYSPDGRDDLIEKRAAEVRKQWAAIRDEELQPRVGESGSPRRGPKVATGTRR
jgi:hypothetical protein